MLKSLNAEPLRYPGKVIRDQASIDKPKPFVNLHNLCMIKALAPGGGL